MNEQHINPEPSLDLPLPLPEQGSAHNEANASGYSGEAAQSAALETGAISAVPPPISVPSTQQASDNNTQLAQQTGSMVMGSQGTPAIADDIDLIEKEWVHKAKEIVEHTNGDPYTQNKEMNKVKADYLKKRYNKDLKLEDK